MFTVTVFIQLELAVAAVEYGTVGIHHTEETVLADGDVQTATGVGGRPVGEVLG